MRSSSKIENLVTYKGFELKLCGSTRLERPWMRFTVLIEKPHVRIWVSVWDTLFSLRPTVISREVFASAGGRAWNYSKLISVDIQDSRVRMYVHGGILCNRQSALSRWVKTTYIHDKPRKDLGFLHFVVDYEASFLLNRVNSTKTLCEFVFFALKDVGFKTGVTSVNIARLALDPSVVAFCWNVLPTRWKTLWSHGANFGQHTSNSVFFSFILRNCSDCKLFWDVCPQAMVVF